MGLTCPTDTHAKDAPDYNQHIAPLLAKYCVACHNADDREGKLSLESFAQLQQGGAHGPALLAGDSRASRLVRLLNGAAEPRMPPEGSEAPSEAEIALLTAWIDAGARGPGGKELPPTLLTPKLPAAEATLPVTALAYSPNGQFLAVARFQTVELFDGAGKKLIRTLEGAAGKINRLTFTADGKTLIAASGIDGLHGQACLWEMPSGKLLRTIPGHRDVLYAAVPSPDGSLLATAGYDRRILLWDLTTGKELRSFEGHNGAVFDLAFSPDGGVLASASADDTVKLWHVLTGARLDTLGQPLKEQYAVTFHPAGTHVLAAGADNRIRSWRFVSKDRPRINPPAMARFAHEGAISHLAFTPDGQALVTVSEDRAIKLWETKNYTQIHRYESQPDVVAAIAISPQGKLLAVGRMDGSLEFLPLNTHAASPVKPPSAQPEKATAQAQTAAEALKDIQEQEPNDDVDSAQTVQLPATVSGKIAGGKQAADRDVFRFEAAAGSEWVLEVNAAQSKSQLDSKLEVLTEQGQPIPRVLLQAVRDSYFTFRGKDSDTSDDFRVHNWEEMELNEYLFADGEVVKLWLYPRGPDSGFKVYPGSGKRYTYFDTTPTSHALQAPCYVVRPLPPGAEPIPNGLPTFPIYYENDDDSRRRHGSDSRLTFTAPESGVYLVRLADVRGFQGDDYHYRLTIRPRRPDFKLTVTGLNPTVPAGSGREFGVKAERLDDFEGQIEVNISGLPPGFHATSPLIIEAGQDEALGAIWADADAAEPTAENAEQSQVTAAARLGEQTLSHDLNGLGKIKLGPAPKVRVTLLPAGGADGAAATVADDGRLAELAIRPGQTITAKVAIDRTDFAARVSFGGPESGRNLPHGVFVDNIGLNGLLIVEGQQERTFFITAAPWVPEGRRLFHLKTDVDGGQTSQPVWLKVLPPSSN